MKYREPLFLIFLSLASLGSCQGGGHIGYNSKPIGSSSINYDDGQYHGSEDDGKYHPCGDEGQYHPTDEGRYIPDDSGQYRGDGASDEGRYYSSNEGQYIPDSGQYLATSSGSRAGSKYRPLNSQYKGSTGNYATGTGSKISSVGTTSTFQARPVSSGKVSTFPLTPTNNGHSNIFPPCSSSSFGTKSVIGGKRPTFPSTGFKSKTSLDGTSGPGGKFPTFSSGPKLDLGGPFTSFPRTAPGVQANINGNVFNRPNSKIATYSPIPSETKPGGKIFTQSGGYKSNFGGKITPFPSGPSAGNKLPTITAFSGPNPNLGGSTATHTVGLGFERPISKLPVFSQFNSVSKIKQDGNFSPYPTGSSKQFPFSPSTLPKSTFGGKVSTFPAGPSISGPNGKLPIFSPVPTVSKSDLYAKQLTPTSSGSYSKISEVSPVSSVSKYESVGGKISSINSPFGTNGKFSVSPPSSFSPKSELISGKVASFPSGSGIGGASSKPSVFGTVSSIGNTGKTSAFATAFENGNKVPIFAPVPSVPKYEPLSGKVSSPSSPFGTSGPSGKFSVAPSSSFTPKSELISGNVASFPSNSGIGDPSSKSSAFGTLSSVANTGKTSAFATGFENGNKVPIFSPVPSVPFGARVPSTTFSVIPSSSFTPKSELISGKVSSFSSSSGIVGSPFGTNSPNNKFSASSSPSFSPNSELISGRISAFPSYESGAPGSKPSVYSPVPVSSFPTRIGVNKPSDTYSVSHIPSIAKLPTGSITAVPKSTTVLTGAAVTKPLNELPISSSVHSVSTDPGISSIDRKPSTFPTVADGISGSISKVTTFNSVFNSKATSSGNILPFPSVSRIDGPSSNKIPVFPSTATLGGPQISISGKSTISGGQYRSNNAGQYKPDGSGDGSRGQYRPSGAGQYKSDGSGSFKSGGPSSTFPAAPSASVFGGGQYKTDGSGDGSRGQYRPSGAGQYKSDASGNFKSGGPSSTFPTAPSASVFGGSKTNTGSGSPIGGGQYPSNAGLTGSGVSGRPSGGAGASNKFAAVQFSPAFGGSKTNTGSGGPIGGGQYPINTGLTGSGVSGRPSGGAGAGNKFAAVPFSPAFGGSKTNTGSGSPIGGGQYPSNTGLTGSVVSGGPSGAGANNKFAAVPFSPAFGGFKTNTGSGSPIGGGQYPSNTGLTGSVVSGGPSGAGANNKFAAVPFSPAFGGSKTNTGSGSPIGGGQYPSNSGLTGSVVSGRPSGAGASNKFAAVPFSPAFGGSKTNTGSGSPIGSGQYPSNTGLIGSGGPSPSSGAGESNKFAAVPFSPAFGGSKTNTGSGSPIGGGQYPSTTGLTGSGVSGRPSGGAGASNNFAAAPFSPAFGGSNTNTGSGSPIGGGQYPSNAGLTGSVVSGRPSGAGASNKFAAAPFSPAFGGSNTNTGSGSPIGGGQYPSNAGLTGSVVSGRPSGAGASNKFAAVPFSPAFGGFKTNTGSGSPIGGGQYPSTTGLTGSGVSGRPSGGAGASNNFAAAPFSPAFGGSNTNTGSGSPIGGGQYPSNAGLTGSVVSGRPSGAGASNKFAAVPFSPAFGGSKTNTGSGSPIGVGQYPSNTGLTSSGVSGRPSGAGASTKFAAVPFSPAFGGSKTNTGSGSPISGGQYPSNTGQYKPNGSGVGSSGQYRPSGSNQNKPNIFANSGTGGGGQYRPSGDGQYKPNNAGSYGSGGGQYRPSGGGQYKHDGSGSYSGQYVPDDLGKYVHIDEAYKHQDVGGGGYQHQPDRGDKYQPDSSGGGGYKHQPDRGDKYKPDNSGGGGYKHQPDRGDQYKPDTSGGGGYKHQPDIGDKYRPENSGGGKYNPQKDNSGGYKPQGGDGGYNPNKQPFGTGTGSEPGGNGPTYPKIGLEGGQKVGSDACSYESLRNYKIIRQKGELHQDNYHYLYETENCMYGEEQGQVHNKGMEDEVMRAVGIFYYVGPDKMKYTVTYTADENGFIPHGDHLPKAPPVPAAILRSLEYQKSVGAL